MQCLKNYGYKLTDEQDHFFSYEKEELLFADIFTKRQIIFYPKSKTIRAQTGFMGCAALDLTAPELKAINEKVKELGWEE